jgi:hypothetical protein
MGYRPAQAEAMKKYSTTRKGGLKIVKKEAIVGYFATML